MGISQEISPQNRICPSRIGIANFPAPPFFLYKQGQASPSSQPWSIPHCLPKRAKEGDSSRLNQVSTPKFKAAQTLFRRVDDWVIGL